MPQILDLRNDLKEYIRRHGIKKKWQKAIELFANDLSHPSLHTELLEPKHRLIVKEEDLIEVIAITKHYRK